MPLNLQKKTIRKKKANCVRISPLSRLRFARPSPRQLQQPRPVQQTRPTQRENSDQRDDGERLRGSQPANSTLPAISKEGADFQDPQNPLP